MSAGFWMLFLPPVAFTAVVFICAMVWTAWRDDGGPTVIVPEWYLRIVESAERDAEWVARELGDVPRRQEQDSHAD